MMAGQSRNEPAFVGTVTVAPGRGMGVLVRKSHVRFRLSTFPSGWVT